MNAVLKEDIETAGDHQVSAPSALQASRLIRPDSDQDAAVLWASRISWQMSDSATVRDCLDGASCYLSTALGTFDREENMADCDHAGVVLVNLAAQMVSSAHSKLMAYDRDSGRQAEHTGAPASPERIDDSVLMHRAALLDAFLQTATDGIAEEARARYLNDKRIAGSESDFVALVRDLSSYVHEASADYNLSYGHAWGIVEPIEDKDDAREKLIEEFGLMHYPITNPVARQQALADRVRQIVSARQATAGEGNSRGEDAIRLTGLPIEVIPQFDTVEDGIETVHTLLKQINATMQQESESFSQPLWSTLQQIDMALGVQSKVIERMPRRVAA